MRIRIPYKKVYVFIVVFLFLYTSDSIYTYVFFKYDHAIEILADLLMLMTVFVLDKKVVLRVIGYDLAISLLLLLVASISYKSTEYLFLGAMLLRLISVSLFVQWCYFQKIDFLGILCTIVFFMAVFFLLCYVFFDLGLSGISPQMVNVAGFNGAESRKSIYGCYCGFYYRWDFSRRMLGYRVMACNGFFREVGVYQIYLNFALYWYMFAQQGYKKRIIVLIMALVSTFSVMGWLVFAVMVAMKLLKRTRLGVSLGVVAFVTISFMMYSVLNDKFMHYTRGRQGNIAIAFEWIKQGGLMGNGYNRNYTSWYGILNYFIHFGIAGIVPVLFFICGTIRGALGTNIKSVIAIVGWWGLCLMNEAAGYNMFFIALYVICAIQLIEKVSYMDIVACTKESEV